MNIQISVGAPADEKADLLAIGCAEDTLEDSHLLDAFDTTLTGYLRAAIKDERFKGKAGQTLVFPGHGRLAAGRLALLGLGKRAAVGLPALRTFAGRAARLAQSVGARRLALLTPLGFLGPQPDLTALVERLVEGVLLGGYRFDKYLSEDKRTPLSLTDVTLLLGSPATPALRGGHRQRPARRRRHRPRARSHQRAGRLHDPHPPGRGRPAPSPASTSSAAPSSAATSVARWTWACSWPSPRAASRSRASST